MTRSACTHAVVGGTILAVILAVTVWAFLVYIDPVFVLTFASTANFCN